MTSTQPDPFGPIPASDDFVITHIFDAPRRLVWAAYTKPEHLSHWWAPPGFKLLAIDVDPRPGGSFRYGLEAPDGAAMWGRWVYQVVDAPRRIVAVVSFINAAGDVVRHPMEPHWPLGMMSSTILEEQGGRTMLTVVARPDGGTVRERETFVAGRGLMKQGFNGSFAMLDSYLATLPGDAG